MSTEEPKANSADAVKASHSKTDSKCPPQTVVVLTPEQDFASFVIAFKHQEIVKTHLAETRSELSKVCNKIAQSVKEQMVQRVKAEEIDFLTYHVDLDGSEGVFGHVVIGQYLKQHYPALQIDPTTWRECSERRCRGCPNITFNVILNLI